MQHAWSTGDSIASTPITVTSTSAATDGGFVAISEIAALVGSARYRLIGGLAVLLHNQRLGLDHPIRGTADADIGVPPFLLKDGSLVERIEELGYRRASGNRWQRSIDATRTATIDLLVPSYRTRTRPSVQHGPVNTVEVGGLDIALRRAPTHIAANIVLTDGSRQQLEIVIPDPASMLGLKLYARRHRDQPNDSIDLWTCLEAVVVADEVRQFDHSDFDDIRPQLSIEFADDGPSMATILRGWSESEQQRRRTRIRGLVRAILG